MNGRLLKCMLSLLLALSMLLGLLPVFAPEAAAVNHAETGSFSGKPEYMCRMTQTFVETLRAATE